MAEFKGISTELKYHPPTPSAHTFTAIVLEVSKLLWPEKSLSLFLLTEMQHAESLQDIAVLRRQWQPCVVHIDRTMPTPKQECNRGK